MFCQTYFGEGEIDLVEYRAFPDANGRTIHATIMDGGEESVFWPSCGPQKQVPEIVGGFRRA